MLTVGCSRNEAAENRAFSQKTEAAPSLYWMSLVRAPPKSVFISRGALGPHWVYAVPSLIECCPRTSSSVIFAMRRHGQGYLPCSVSILDCEAIVAVAAPLSEDIEHQALSFRGWFVFQVACFRTHGRMLLAADVGRARKGSHQRLR
jgi:hypothetical protein